MENLLVSKITRTTRGRGKNKKEFLHAEHQSANFDFGHQSPYKNSEWRDVAEEYGIPQGEFDSVMRDPKMYYLEDRPLNQSGKRDNSGYAQHQATRFFEKYMETRDIGKAAAAAAAATQGR